MEPMILLALAPLVCLTAKLPSRQSSLEIGDEWVVERTYHCVDDLAKLDFTVRERTSYKVEQTNRQGTTILISRHFLDTPPGPHSDSSCFPQHDASGRLHFGVGGAPTYGEEFENPIRARVDRMLWTAAEDRKGILWTRKFAESVAMPEGKVTVRPSETYRTQTVSISYEEPNDKVLGDATATVSLPVRVVESCTLTLTGVALRNVAGTFRVEVSQKLVPKS
jgi:hypothetical protein